VCCERREVEAHKLSNSSIKAYPSTSVLSTERRHCIIARAALKQKYGLRTNTKSRRTRKVLIKAAPATLIQSCLDTL
jgi:hypothetical protein